MNEESEVVGDDELHALVDGALDPGRAAAVTAWLLQHPGDASRVAQWQAQRLQLRLLHRTIELGETPHALTAAIERAVRRPRWRQGAAAAVVLAVGVTTGHLWQRGPPAEASGPAFVREAALAYAVYVPEVRHPVEVGAEQEAHLVQWLTRRLGAQLKAPSLLAEGFRLLGGRLLPGAQGPCAQFMYEDARGRRVTLYVRVFDKAPNETVFRTERDGAVESFYWIDGRLGYAFSAELPHADAMALARDVYRQLSPS
jgi:anti-sigma factor RsiW